MPTNKAHKQGHESTAQSSAKKSRADDADIWRNSALPSAVHEENSSEQQKRGISSNPRANSPKDSRINDNIRSSDPINVTELSAMLIESKDNDTLQNVQMTSGGVHLLTKTIGNDVFEVEDIETPETDFDILEDLLDMEKDFKTDLKVLENRFNEQLRNMDNKYSSRFHKIRSHIERQGITAEIRKDSPKPSRRESPSEKREIITIEPESPLPDKWEMGTDPAPTPIASMSTSVQQGTPLTRESLSPSPAGGGLKTEQYVRVDIQCEHSIQLHDRGKTSIIDQAVGLVKYGRPIDKRTTARSTWDRSYAMHNHDTVPHDIPPG